MTTPYSAGVERKGAAAVSGTLGVLSWQPSPIATVQLSTGEVHEACSYTTFEIYCKYERALSPSL